LQAATAQQFDVVVIDRKLRGDDGLQLMVQLKSMNAGLPVIVLSGYCDDSSVVSALDQGAFEYLTKPCGLADLEATVNRALALRRLESTEHSHLQETIVGTPCHAFLLRAPMPAT
jgi:DNA-binding NtrC family response regulator